MADNIALIKLEVQVADGQLKIDRLKSKLKELTKGGEDYNLTLKRIQIAEDNLNKVQSKRISVQSNLEKSTKKLTKAQVQKKNAVGASTSATLELGRVLSDMPYGIRGVANNLQQLASNLFFMSKATDAATGKSVGFMGAIKRLLGGLIGPAGILIAFQGAIALLDYFKVGMNSSKESTEEADKATRDFSSSLKSLEKTLTDSGVSQDSYNQKIREYIALKKLEKKVEESILSTKSDIEKKEDSIQKTKEDDIKLEKRLLEAKEKAAEQANKVYPDTAIGRQAKAQAVDYSKTVQEIESRLRNNITVRKGLEEDIVQLTKDGVDEITKLEEAKKKLSLAEKGTLKFYKQQKADLEKIRQETSKTSEEYKKQGVEIERIQKLIEEIEGTKGKGSTKSKISLFKSKKELDLDVKNQEDALLQFEKKIRLQTLRNSELEELSSAKTEKEKTKIKRKYAAQRLEIELSIEEKKLILAKSNERQIAKIKHDEHVANLNRILEEYKLELKLKKPANADKLKSDAESATKKSEVQAGAELIKTYGEIDDAYKPLFETFKKLAKLRRDALGILPDDKKSEEFDALSSYLESFKIAMSGITEFVNGEYDRQLTIEQNKTNALNEQLNNRLLNEQLSADQRKNIQNQIYQNDEILRKKQDEIAKKRFNTQKAFNIAMATADSYLAGVRVLKDPFFVGRPWERGIAMAATIASGLASVAAIARQKFQSSSAATPVRTGSGGGASGGAGIGDRSFNFNLVGNTLGNQITDAIQGQFDQPLKAYVVSRDITSQQALDANIKGTASF